MGNKIRQMKIKIEKKRVGVMLVAIFNQDVTWEFWSPIMSTTCAKLHVLTHMYFMAWPSVIEIVYNM